MYPYSLRSNTLGMKKARLIFTLMDLGYKKAGPVQIYDERTLDDDGSIIPFTTQLSIVTHYATLQNSEYAQPYAEKAQRIIDCWTLSLIHI